LLTYADSSCPHGNGTAGFPCGVYECIDIYSGLRSCDPMTDGPIATQETTDELGCDNGPSWGKLKCVQNSETYFRNDTCPWVDNITGWSSIPGLQQCSDLSTCSIISDGPSCCNAHGGKQRCPIDAPYMCAATDQCADGLDRCCLPAPRLCLTSSMRGLRPCNVSFQRITTTCALDGCSPADAAPARGADAAAEACANLSARMAVFPATGNSYQEALLRYGVDLKCLSCLRAACGYCQVTTPPARRRRARAGAGAGGRRRGVVWGRVVVVGDGRVVRRRRHCSGPISPACSQARRAAAAGNAAPGAREAGTALRPPPCHPPPPLTIGTRLRFADGNKARSVRRGWRG
jgi:hypothetical protein